MGCGGVENNILIENIIPNSPHRLEFITLLNNNKTKGRRCEQRCEAFKFVTDLH